MQWPTRQGTVEQDFLFPLLRGVLPTTRQVIPACLRVLLSMRGSRKKRGLTPTERARRRLHCWGPWPEHSKAVHGLQPDVAVRLVMEMQELLARLDQHEGSFPHAPGP